MRCICVSVEADYSLKEYREISDRLCSMLRLVYANGYGYPLHMLFGIFRFATGGIYSPPTLGPRGNLEPSLVYSAEPGKFAIFVDFGTFSRFWHFSRGYIRNRHLGGNFAILG